MCLEAKKRCTVAGTSTPDLALSTCWVLVGNGTRALFPPLSARVVPLHDHLFSADLADAPWSESDFADNGQMAFSIGKPLEHLVYLSQARHGLNHIDVRAILGSAQVRNRRRDVTGFLLYSGKHFVQVLEGRGSVLDDLVAVIRSDSRHERLCVFSRAPIIQRRFGAWAMGFVQSLDDADELELLFKSDIRDTTRIGTLIERAARAI